MKQAKHFLANIKTNNCNMQCSYKILQKAGYEAMTIMIMDRYK